MYFGDIKIKQGSWMFYYILYIFVRDECKYTLCVYSFKYVT